ncbi:TetR/AcrR family transcriptional regulator [Aeromicrobium wangtongii]|uniref:TetR/AcrR family transcriptional regulator n=1 Tax=Aeromicrobium wangtongii TaxID=2969247 RepID=A0ABY5M5H2_9ACTN|nr:TetR/AcrR family transcriptional regulator [Aeromicrobium wangtongii]MCD9200160.1 TetR/AcrR family transcriptional regulator [Aeromicrobium wangtongii]UUP13415.1 TetR/AcrR family transcriptional regulator [Aeromicrobium wangtongii]
MITEECVDAERPLRRDAARNRELILRTAAEVFAEHGLDAGYDEIARRAGVGVGTVYRRFPERAELIEALFESRVDEIVAIAEEAISRPDSFEGIGWFLEQALERQVADRGLTEALAQLPKADLCAVGVERLRAAIETMIERAQADGTLRPDIAAGDVGLQLFVLSSMTTTDQPDLWRRYLALLIEGLRAREGQPRLPLHPPKDDAKHDLLCNIQGR